MVGVQRVWRGRRGNWGKMGKKLTSNFWRGTSYFIFSVVWLICFSSRFHVVCRNERTWIRWRWRSTAGVAGILLVFHLQIAHIILPFPGLKDGCWWAHSPHHCENHMELNGTYEAQQQHTATFQARHANSHCPRETGESIRKSVKIHGWSPPWMERLVEAGEHHQQNAVVKSCSRPLTDLKWGMVYKTHFWFFWVIWLWVLLCLISLKKHGFLSWDDNPSWPNHISGYFWFKYQPSFLALGLFFPTSMKYE